MEGSRRKQHQVEGTVEIQAWLFQRTPQGIWSCNGPINVVPWVAETARLIYFHLDQSLDVSHAWKGMSLGKAAIPGEAASWMLSTDSTPRSRVNKNSLEGGSRWWISMPTTDAPQSTLQSSSVPTFLDDASFPFPYICRQCQCFSNSTMDFI